MELEGVSRKGSASINRAHVNNEGQLAVRSITATETEHAVQEGLAFSIYSGVITFNSADRKAVMYLKNDDSLDIMLTSITIGGSPAANAADNSVLVESVTGVLLTDDIVQNGTDVTIINRNGGSARDFSGTAKKGPSNPAVSGVATTGELSEFTEAQQIELATVVPRGQSAAIEVVPPTGTTSMRMTLTVNFNLIEQV